MVDRDRVLAKLDELDGYLAELCAIVPSSLAEYRGVEKRRACERVLQISVEAVIDVCALLVAGLRLGCPAEEDDLFDKLVRRGILSAPTIDVLRRMRGLRNILMHEYGRVNDALVFEVLRTRLGDFTAFRAEVVAALR